MVTGEICFDKEVGNVGQSFEVRFDIGDVAVVAVKLPKEEECSMRRTMGTTSHPTATNDIIDIVASEEILEMPDTKRSLYKKMRTRKAPFMGHVMRRNGLENLVTTGKIEGQRARGRQRQRVMDDTMKWLRKDKHTETILATKERVEWKTLIANAGLHGT